MPTPGDVVRGFFRAFADRRMDDAAAAFHQDLVVHVTGNNQASGDHHGRDAFVSLVQRMMDLSGGTLRPSPHAITDGDGHAVALLEMHAERDGTAYDWNRVIVYHVEGDLIEEMWIIELDQSAADAAFA